MHLFFVLKEEKEFLENSIRRLEKNLVFHLYLPGIFIDWFQLANIEKKKKDFFRSTSRW